MEFSGKEEQNMKEGEALSADKGKIYPARPIMVQGTASSVGKSLIAAGLCRVLKQDGFRVAPFKSQNMALNSFVTKEGKEMGRAQVVQAEAAGIEPSVDMNPILLKPTTDRRSQVIINGEVYGNMSAVEYHEYKPALARLVKETYDRLAAKNDIVVIEGAGSPAEINLRDKDIVNMGMAELADSPVILVGDIDRGGVFASIAGTMLLLREEEKVRVKGVIINKFRGDIAILKPGLKMLEDIIKIPVLGVLPYTKLNIDDEDSLAERFYGKNSKEAEINVRVVKLPHISNFTDFNVFERIPGVSLKYIQKAEELEEPDMVIIPGSKNTIGDMAFLRESGIGQKIEELSRKQTIIFGICGGYQMLGMSIEDPLEMESGLRKIQGLGLLNVKTVFGDRKVTTQVTASLTDGTGMLKGLSGVSVSGYEIHMGATEYMEDCIPFIEINRVMDKEARSVGGIRNPGGNVFGTYIHGIFDSIRFSAGLINNMRGRKGLDAIKDMDTQIQEFKEKEYDKLADMLRQNLDMDAIYKIVGVVK